MSVSMSRHYGKGYNRRGANMCQTSFAIDKLFKENSNRPSAARSAGTLGKWGITSFTKIRSSTYDSSLTKYSSSCKSQNQNVHTDTDSFSFENDVKTKQESAPKPKKFFKSRNAEPSADGGGQAGNLSGSKAGAEAVQSATGRKSKEDIGSTSKKLYGSKASPKSDHSSSDEYKPPIVLRIFKGTSCIVADTDNLMSPPRTAPVTPPSPKHRQPSKSPSGRSSRRKSVQDDMEPHSPRPKRTRREVIKDPAIQSIISQLISDEEEEGVFEPCELKPVMELQDTQQASIDDASDDSLPLACTEFYLKREASANKENEDNPNTNIIKEDDDAETLLGAKHLLTETNVDFSRVVEKILSPKTEPELDTCQQEPDTADTAETVEAVEERLAESESDSDCEDPLESSGVTLTSCVESGGGLKLVIKKTTDTSMTETINKEDEKAEEEEEETAPVKISPVKKRSIFKSRCKDEGGGGNSKRLALYKHNWNSSLAVEANPPAAPAASASQYEDINEFDLGPLTHVSQEKIDTATGEDVTKVTCDKKDKGYYTVIRNVKKAHQIQESGEFQEFNDDVDYILDALQDNNPVGTRCLSAITLAGKCMAPAFRMHVRAHGTVAKFFKALHDATADQSLGLCTATVMFVLSQDRLNMDLDRDSLELMLNLLECDASHRNALNDCGMSSAQLRKNKQKVRELCAEIQNKGLAKHLNLENITVGQLAMETLLSLTSKRAGEWFKEELRELGGLEHIFKTISECAKSLETYISQWTDPLLDRLRKVDRCLRVLENVTSGNEENQIYLLRFQDGVLLSTVMKLYKMCNDELALYPCTDPSDKTSTGYVLREALLATLKVLINITQEYNSKVFCQTLVDGRVGLIESSLHLLLQVPNYIPDEDKFDLIVLDLTLLINLVDKNTDNRATLMESKAPHDPESIIDRSSRDQLSAVAALVNLFFIHEKSAYEEQVETDAILDGKKEPTDSSSQSTSQGTSQATSQGSQKSKGDEMEETVAKLLQKAGNHMEHTFIGAYIVLLLGYLMMDNKQYESTIRGHLPGHNFKSFIGVLDKFYQFMKMTVTAMGSNQGNKATERVLNYYQNIEKEMKKEQELMEVKDEPTDLSCDRVLDYTMS